MPPSVKSAHAQPTAPPPAILTLPRKHSNQRDVRAFPHCLLPPCPARIQSRINCGCTTQTYEQGGRSHEPPQELGLRVTCIVLMEPPVNANGFGILLSGLFCHISQHPPLVASTPAKAAPASPSALPDSPPALNSQVGLEDVRRRVALGINLPPAQARAVRVDAHASAEALVRRLRAVEGQHRPLVALWKAASAGGAPFRRFRVGHHHRVRLAGVVPARGGKGRSRGRGGAPGAGE